MMFTIPARAFREAMRERGVGRIRDHPITDGAPVTAALWRELSSRERPSVLVTWLREPDLRRLDSLAASGSPSFSLAPGQRFASKGCYIVRPSAEVPGSVSAVSDWLVP